MKTSDIFRVAKYRIISSWNSFCCPAVEQTCKRLVDGPRRWEECEAIMLLLKPDGAKQYFPWWHMDDVDSRLEFLDNCIAHALEMESDCAPNEGGKPGNDLSWLS